ncbi:hypothetical protein BS47DRAFT_1367199 [Hydnum rufescens UP504]|uniref:Uncharacterized protein n=1 Tax=Hydnum rufescens UP504 TaxID=1448309 RepID=A0A9P6AJG1_9AGAM|nr:hypothetical protein BS47DRAFT_1367199 [Hydnum rufescens UP504]
MRRQGPERNVGVHAATQHFNPNPYNNESSTVPHPLRFFLPPQNLIRRMHRQCTMKYRSAQPPKTPTLECPQPIRQQNKYGATHPPKRVCGNIRFSHSAKPPSKESMDKARAKYGHVRSHPGPQPSRIPNPYNDESSTAPHTHFGGCIRFFLPLRNPTRRMHRQRTTKHRSAQPPKTPTLEYPQPIRRRNKYGATTCQSGFSHSTKPPSKESMDKARAKYRHAHSHSRP